MKSKMEKHPVDDAVGGEPITTPPPPFNPNFEFQPHYAKPSGMAKFYPVLPQVVMQSATQLNQNDSVPPQATTVPIPEFATLPRNAKINHNNII
jgi:hypothetical protein